MRFTPEELVRELILERISFVDDGELLRSCSGEEVRSLVVKFALARNELRRLVEPLRLIERLNESLKKTKKISSSKTRLFFSHLFTLD